MTTSRRIDIPLHLINIVVTAVSVSIIVLLLVPTKMKRAASPTIYNPRNRTWTDDSLMMEMRVVQWINFVRSVPDAHIDVNDEELNEFWLLPPNTRLSPLMKSIGRCRMAVDMRIEEIRKKGGVDADQCNGFETGAWHWTMMVAAIVQLVLCHRRAMEIVDSSSRATIATRSSRIVVEIARSKLVVLVLTVASSINWCVVCVAFLIDHHPLGNGSPTGIVYTLENEIKPIAYYSLSWSHVALGWLNVSMMIVLSVEFVAAWFNYWWFVFTRTKKVTKKSVRPAEGMPPRFVESVPPGIAEGLPPGVVEALSKPAVVSPSQMVLSKWRSLPDDESSSSSSSNSSVIKPSKEDMDE